MSTAIDPDRICKVIEKALKEATAKDTLSNPITPQSSMESVEDWDSLSFIAVFMAVHQAFNLEPDEDDAIHFTSVPGILEFLESAL